MRPHNPRLSRDLQMHNACATERDRERERGRGRQNEKKRRRGEAEEQREGRRRGDMQAKVIRNSLQGTPRSRGEG